MQAVLELQTPQSWPSLTGNRAHPGDETRLPAELDTSVLERTAQLQKLNEELASRIKKQKKKTR